MNISFDLTDLLSARNLSGVVSRGEPSSVALNVIQQTVRAERPWFFQRAFRYVSDFAVPETETLEQAVNGLLVENEEIARKLEEERIQRIKIEKIAQDELAAWNGIDLRKGCSGLTYPKDRYRMNLDVEILLDGRSSILMYRNHASDESDSDWLQKNEEYLDKIGKEQGIPGKALKEMLAQQMSAGMVKCLITKYTQNDECPKFFSRASKSKMYFKFDFHRDGLKLTIDALYKPEGPVETLDQKSYATTSVFEFVKTKQEDGTAGWPEAKSLCLTQSEIQDSTKYKLSPWQQETYVDLESSPIDLA